MLYGLPVKRVKFFPSSAQGFAVVAWIASATQSPDVKGETMSRKTILRTAVAAGAVALGVLGAATPAQAADVTVYTTQGGGFLTYNDYVSDDRFFLRDYLDDGFGVSGEIRSEGGSLLSWNYVGGAGNSTTWYRDLAKSKDYFIRVCLVSSISDTTPINCAGEWVHDD